MCVCALCLMYFYKFLGFYCWVSTANIPANVYTFVYKCYNLCEVQKSPACFW